jgi:hypothetical protein
VQIEALALRLRPRTAFEAADLGVRLCQTAARSVFPCYLMVAVPLMGIALASIEIASWLPIVTIWCAKPWLDRTILFVLSRAAFGQKTVPSDVWQAQRAVWWSQWPFTWTIRRLSLWRSLTQPVYQLEGLSIRRAGARVRQLRRRSAGPALIVTSVFALSEAALVAALISLVFWFAPAGQAPDVLELMAGELPVSFLLVLAGAYATTVLFLEPFYVAAGFAMYLNRRAELEAWDIEQEFRRAFAH